ncbi:MAG: PEP-CTERM sorting domain-containing protein [Proteobacteria bacterium]|nr:PEP-CTERM sorting domain-containing protein [Pseudomonadota bacterium]
MKKALTILCAILLAVGLSGSASALVFELDHYDINLNDTDPGLVLNYGKILSTPGSGDLSLGASYTTQLFKLWTNETTVNGDDTVPQNIFVDFYFTRPDSFTGTVGGQTNGNRSSWWIFSGYYQYGAVTWSGPQTLYFGPEGDGELLVSLSDATFNAGFFGLNEGRCPGAVIDVTFTYLKEASSQAPVPEPATMLLLGFGLIGIAGVTRKKLQ